MERVGGIIGEEVVDQICKERRADLCCYKGIVILNNNAAIVVICEQMHSTNIGKENGHAFHERTSPKKMLLQSITVHFWCTFLVYIAKKNVACVKGLMTVWRFKNT